MTVLDELRSAALRLIGRKPSTFFSSTETFEMEMCDLATEVGRDIAYSHDWQALVRIAVITGNGVNVGFDRPPDYRRMLVHADMIDADNMTYRRVTDINEFVRIRQGGIGGGVPGCWTIYGGQFRFSPIIPAGVEVKFPYVTGDFALDANDNPKSTFTEDTDAFRLPGRLLVLGLVWKWRQNKRLDHGEDEANFIKVFNDYAGRDRGSRIFATGPMRTPGNLTVAYPFTLGP